MKTYVGINNINAIFQIHAVNQSLNTFDRKRIVNRSAETTGERFLDSNHSAIGSKFKKFGQFLIFGFITKQTFMRNDLLGWVPNNLLRSISL